MDVSEAAGVADWSWGFGCTVGDFDNDGWPDLYVSNFGPNVLYHNLGDGRFEDLSQASGVADASWSSGAAFLDADGDGLLDLYVANYLDFNVQIPPLDGKLVRGSRLSCTWAGKPVMCGPAGLPAAPDRFYRNRGDGSFEDATTSSGIAAAPAAYGFAALPFDYDDDGDVDIFVSNDSVENYLWRNDGGGHFVNVALAAGAALDKAGKPQASMGIDAQDYDGDGLIDLFFTNFSLDHNTLLRNLGTGQFEDVSLLAGLATSSYDRLGWATSSLDVDNDGDLDLLVVNGHVYPGAADSREGRYRQRNQLFLNSGGGRFEDVSDKAGVPFQERRVGRGAAFADFDGDGGIDVCITNLDDAPVLLRNTASRGHYLELDSVGTRSNRDALGARVRIETSLGSHQLRDLHSGSSYASSSALRVHFGLGAAERVRRLEVRWPSGATSLLEDIAADQTLLVREDAPGRSGAGQ